MHYRRIASFLAGAWIAASIFMGMVATGNFHTVDRLLSAPSPAAARVITTLGHDNARMFLRYLASEENRRYFDQWELAQIALGLFLVAALYLGTQVNRLILGTAGMMVILVTFMHFFLTPEITFLGRGLDFVLPDQGNRSRFWVLHGLYSAAEVLKLVLGTIVAVYLFRFKAKSRRSLTEELDEDYLKRRPAVN
jgi:hypothetical protein